MSTPTPSLEDLRQAAVAAEQTPAAPPEAPPPSDPWQVKTTDGGNYEVTIEGQVFKGTHQQVLNELAKAQYHATHTIRDTRTELERLKTPPPPPTPVAPVATEPAEVVQARQFLLEETAKALGFNNADEYKSFLSRGRQVVENTEQTGLVSQFYNLVPEFPNMDEKAVDTLIKTHEENGLPMTPQGLRAAHLIAVTEQKYKPLTPDEIRVQQAKALGLDLGTFKPPTPAPMVPSSSGVQTEAPFNPYDPKVPLDKVREWALKANQ